MNQNVRCRDQENSHCHREAQAADDRPGQRGVSFASGAQFISTDYMEPDTRFGDYIVVMPGQVVARRNPVMAGR